MRTAIRQLLILWLSLLILGGLSFLILQLPPMRAWLWQHTGEEEFLAQVKGLTDLLSDRLRPPLALAPDATILYADVNPFGVNTFLEQEAEPAKRVQAIEMAAAAGYHWLRQEFPWEDIEIHGKGDFEDRRHEPYRSAWEKYDQIVAAAEANGMELIVRLSNPPGWTRAQGEGENNVDTFAPPDNVQDYADFVSAVVSRYKGRIKYYQLWNEPNIYPEWGSYPIDPEGYVKLLKAGAEAARAADPNVVIIAGATASTINLQPDDPPPGNSLNDLLFLQRMYDAGAAPYFDIMAMQGYGLYSGPTDNRMHPRVINISRHQFVRDLMVKNGDAHKPIWIAEMNWNAAPEDVDPRYGRVTLAQQARYLPMAYQRVIDDWPWIGVANTWYLKRATDLWEQNRQPEAYFRLLAPDFTPQPVYESMRAFTAGLEK
ncbi:MAG TPA: cellulase family glycosylhydrolase [Chloroflexi bacterium]|nr:cellulase family glycosylhydrolase [Chloroflexota bacterium]